MLDVAEFGDPGVELWGGPSWSSLGGVGVVSRSGGSSVDVSGWSFEGEPTFLLDFVAFCFSVGRSEGVPC